MFQPGTITLDGVTLPYQVLVPKIRTTERVPLVVFLHGAGERGTDNEGQLKWFCRAMAEPDMVQRHPCILLAVQCPNDRMWVEVAWSEQTSRPMAAEPTLPMRAVLQAMTVVEQRYADWIDLDRVYLTGLSMGGYGSWDLAMREPHRFAAVAPVCGGGDEREAHRLLSLPVWTFHGDQDPAVPVGRSRAMVAALRALGHPVRYTELPKVGHDSWRQAYGKDGVIDWLFEQDRRRQARGDVRSFAIVPAPLQSDVGDGEFAARPGMRVVAGKQGACGAMLAAELQRCLGCPVPVVADTPAPGDVVLLVADGPKSELQAEAGGRLEFGAVARIVARDPAELARCCGAFLQALGSLPGLRAPFGTAVCRPPGEDCLVLEFAAGDISLGVLQDAVRRAWLVGMGTIYVAGDPPAALVAAGQLRGVVVAGVSALPERHVRPLRVRVDAAHPLASGLRMALPDHREQPTEAQRAEFHARLARAARAVGW